MESDKGENDTSHKKSVFTISLHDPIKIPPPLHAIQIASMPWIDYDEPTNSSPKMKSAKENEPRTPSQAKDMGHRIPSTVGFIFASSFKMKADEQKSLKTMDSVSLSVMNLKRKATALTQSIEKAKEKFMTPSRPFFLSQAMNGIPIARGGSGSSTLGKQDGSSQSLLTKGRILREAVR